jgi:hypothetical protein
VEDEGAGPSAEELGRLQQQKLEAVAKLLSPQELEQFDLWFSPAASRARESIYGMEATEEEFLKLYQLRREFETKLSSADSTQNLNEPGTADQELHARIQQALGAERFEEYVRAQDPDFRELYALTSRLKLPRATAVELHGYKAAVEAARASVQVDDGLDAEQRATAQRAITEETQRAFKEKLGDKAFKQFIRRTGNRWVKGQ